VTIGLFLFEDVVEAGRPLAWRASPRAIFVRSGSVAVSGQQLAAEACALFEGAVEVAGAGEIWTFELSGAPVADMAEADRTRVVLAHDVDLDPSAPVLFRADRVNFPVGAVTPRHGHKGAGIRRLVHGRLMAEIGAEVRRIDPGTAWFETGRDPVVGRNLAPSSSFVRALALDPALKGLPTFSPWSEEEAAKPRGTRPAQFFDVLVRVPPPGGS
jgi:hypothetical protein